MQSYRNESVKLIKIDIKKKRINSKEGGLWVLAYILTPKGIHDVIQRSKGQKINTSTADDFVVKKKNSSANCDLDSMEIDFEQVNNFFYYPDEFADEIQIESSDNNKHIQKAINALKYIANVLDYNFTRLKHLLSAFDSYINGYITDLIANISMNLFNWASLSENNQFSDLSDIALRLEPATCSEAAAERAISTQRLIMEPRMDTAKQDLTDARLIYMSTKENKK